MDSIEHKEFGFIICFHGRVGCDNCNSFICALTTFYIFSSINYPEISSRNRILMSDWFEWPTWGKFATKRDEIAPPLDSGPRPPSRSRSSSRRRRSRRRSSELTPAERLARAKGEKKVIEFEEQRVASLDPLARSAHKERKRLWEEQRIKDLKNTFAIGVKEAAEQQNTAYVEVHRRWKRKHDDDTAAQAAQRRLEFLEVRQRQLQKSPSQPTSKTIFAPTLINSETYDPYAEISGQPHHKSWQRFLTLASNPSEVVNGTGYGIGLDSAAVLMLSESFRNALRYGERPDGSEARSNDEEFSLIGRWREFEIKLRLEHVSIRAFAIARRIPYMMVYRRTGQKIAKGAKIANENIQLDPSIRDPYEVYLASDGRLLPCLFTPLSGDFESVRQEFHTLPFSKFEEDKPHKEIYGTVHERVISRRFQNLKENVYNRENFKNYAPPSSWPPTWEYPPADIQHPCREWGKNYPACVACGLRTGPLEAAGEEEICQCTTLSVFDKILVEIKEYTSSTTSKQLYLGIRALQKLHKEHIIGEVLGEFIPLGAEADFKCHYNSSVDFHAPPFVDKNGKVLDVDPDVITEKPIDTNTDPIATLITGHKGGWIRLINAGTNKTANVEARSEVWAGKLRVTIRPLRNINFGEQLLIRWGDIYLEPDGQSLNARKKRDHTERLPMRALSGFFK
ncbi:7c483636-37a8-49ab-b7b6-f1bba3b5c82a [Sclerotinia trifoliorum]|uniref:7c483636-37a8-49ab-b7b6-f1bba3b5c82a n=1 Tax=Sclerotinia trifoliorum TaxID=28548 RepID=A0A8H2VTH5_9HELO|nr:7c483636-37a8-49ab-b7b6-f1bba3b5c82a [Sclerotinia trifoliorum]